MFRFAVALTREDPAVALTREDPTVALTRLEHSSHYMAYFLRDPSGFAKVCESEPVNTFPHSFEVCLNMGSIEPQGLCGSTNARERFSGLITLNPVSRMTSSNHLLSDVLGHVSGLKRDHLLNGYVSRVTRANDHGPSHSYRDTSGTSNISDLMLLEVVLDLLGTCGFFHNDPFKIG